MRLLELAAKFSFELTRTPLAPRRTQRDCVLHGFRFAAAGYADNQVFTCIPDGASDRVAVSQFSRNPGFGGRPLQRCDCSVRTLTSAVERVALTQRRVSVVALDL